MRFLPVLALSLTCSIGLAAEAAKPKKPLKLSLCSSCHGEKGISPAALSAPHLAGQKKAYLIKELQDFKKGERKGNVMRSIAKTLTQRQIEDLATWYSQPIKCKK